jgi:hypothetical protein
MDDPSLMMMMMMMMMIGKTKNGLYKGTKRGSYTVLQHMQ